MDVNLLKEYEGGSFIVWCRPFSVWMGGGQIGVDSQVAVSATGDSDCSDTTIETDPPASDPTTPSKLPMLAAEMSGTSGYNVGGTITIGYRQDLVDGEAVQIPTIT